MKYYYEGVERLDWFGNPNVTAALLVQLMLIPWLLVYLKLGKRSEAIKFGLNVSVLALTTIVGILLIKTYSRGGVFAALICFTILGGSFILNLNHKKTVELGRRKLKLVATIAVIIVLLVVGKNSKLDKRINSVFDEDQSVHSRLTIYKIIPSMIIDAPDGWGEDNAVESYYQYYQPLNRQVEYQNLLSGHFTRLVELSWFGRFCYMMGCFILLSITFPLKNDRASIVCFLSLLSFFITDCFSYVSCSIMVFLPSMFAVIISLKLHRNSLKRRRSIGLFFLVVKRVFLIPVVFVVLVIALINFLSHQYSSHYLHYENGVVSYKKEINKYWIITPQNSIEVYDAWGKAIRRSDFSSNIMLDSREFSQINEGDILILAGSIPNKLELKTLECGVKVILLNPSISPDKWFERSLSSKHELKKVIFGEFVNNSYKNEWINFCKLRGEVKVSIVDGEGVYLENWCDYVKDL